ncbi:efflux RND transporter periplasmic adaptor subunit [bacterium]|nr:efflux RND transporter periplasmic adaptor subunit [bacterium]
MKIKKKNLFIAIGIVAVLAIIIIANLKKGGQKTVVQTEKVVRGTITETVSGSARIQPEIQVKISAKVSGQIVRLGVEEGDRVTKGQFLVQLDEEFYRAAVEQAESGLKYAKAAYEKAKSEYERYQKLFDGNLASQSELDIYRSSYQQASANVEQGDAQLKQARDNLSKTIIYSPMDGVVSQLNKKLGEMAMGSNFTLDVIMTVADLSRMQAEAEIDENDVVNVTLNDSSRVSVDAFPDTTFFGQVREIANTGTTLGAGTQNEITNFLVKVAMVEKPASLRPGMSATVDIITENKDKALKVPIQCVTTRSPVKPEDKEKAAGKKKEKSSDQEKEEPSADSLKTDEAKKKEEKPIKVVFVVKDGVAHQVPVETGISSDTEWELKSGPEEGDEVVSGSFRILSRQLKDGDLVKVDNSVKKSAENK